MMKYQHFVPSSGLQANPDNKFFAFTPTEEPKEQDLVPAEPRKMEFFDSAREESNNSSFVDLGSEQTSFLPIREEKKPDLMKPAPMDFTKEDVGEKELSNNNKFFTPIQERHEVEMVSAAQREVDPMEAVDKLSNPEKEQEEIEKDLKYAITQIRNCIQGLGDQGFYINVEEIDFDAEYQITINIDKGN